MTDFSELRSEVLYAAKQQGIPPEKIKFDWYTLSYPTLGQEPVRAKRDRNGNIVLHVAALMYNRPADPVQEALDYLACFKAAPQTLYVRRQLLNGKAFTDWAKAQGFPTTLFDLHVTIAFSREPVDWKKFTPAQDNLEIKGGERSIEALGPNKEAVVLRFESADLVKRWNEFIGGGASWDWPSYQPHVTISFKADGVDLANVTPFDGTLVFGPEEFAEVKEDWKDTAVEREFDEGKHPRDDHGRFSDSGGGEGSDSSSGEGKHPGEGYSASARLIGGVIHTSSVYDAQRALYENRKVELNQPRSVSVLLKRLGEVAKKMIAEGKEAPLFNLCNVSVKGTNLFCADTKGIPRVEMPQLDADQTKAFVKHLKEIGFKVEKDKVHANHLRATQNEINGAKVAATAEKMRGKEGKINKRLVVSKDDYILDGHHHWAAKVGLDAEDGSLTNDTKVRISRVNISITKLLDEAEKFTGGKGKIGVDVKSIGDIIGMLVREFDESKHPRGQPENAGQFGSGGGGGDTEASSAKEQAPAPNDPAQFSFSKKETDAFGTYINDSTDLNKYIRSGDKGNKEFDATIDALNSALQKSSLNTETTLFRGMFHDAQVGKNPTARELYKNAEKLIGKSVPLGGFQSTSYDENVALEFSGAGNYNNPVVLEITVPAGTHAIDMQPFADNFAKQKEFLIGQGSFKIDSVERTGGRGAPVYVKGTYKENG